MSEPDPPKPRASITFIACNPGEPIPPQPTREEEDLERAEEHAHQLWLAEAADHCRCGDLWRPCEGVLAGGMCDELGGDDDVYDDDLDEDDDDAYDPWTGVR